MTTDGGGEKNREHTLKQAVTVRGRERASCRLRRGGEKRSVPELKLIRKGVRPVSGATTQRREE